MSGTIDNGRRVPVAFGKYAGQAGVAVRANGDTEVAFFAPARDFRRAVGTTGTIDGVDYAVIGSAPSATVPGMIVLTVTAVTPGA